MRYFRAAASTMEWVREREDGFVSLKPLAFPPPPPSLDPTVANTFLEAKAKWCQKTSKLSTLTSSSTPLSSLTSTYTTIGAERRRGTRSGNLLLTENSTTLTSSLQKWQVTVANARQGNFLSLLRQFFDESFWKNSILILSLNGKETILMAFEVQ